MRRGEYILLSLLNQGSVIHLLLVSVLSSGNPSNVKGNWGACVWTCVCSSEEHFHLNSLQTAVLDPETVIQEL